MSSLAPDKLVFRGLGAEFGDVLLVKSVHGDELVFLNVH